LGSAGIADYNKKGRETSQVRIRFKQSGPVPIAVESVGLGMGIADGSLRRKVTPLTPTYGYQYVRRVKFI
jgi:hypothetical protein